MRSFAKKLACVLASAAMVVTMFPAAKAQAAAEFGLNATEKILYVNAREDAPYNKQMFDFNFKKAPKGYLNDYTFAWATDKPEVATVKAGGIVTAVASGVANITCVVTNKETKEQVTVSAKVTVRENAKEVVISNAAKYEDTAVGVGGVVDLNRTMITADGRKTSGKRTTTSAVTDRTMWATDPESDGIKINQSNGKFTFTDKAEAGTYKLYCYTYQSTKHPEKVAVSEPVTVEFTKDIDIDVTQNSVTKFTVNFGSVVTADVDKSTVSIVRLDPRADKTYEFPSVIKSVELNKTTGKSLTVELFSAVVDKATYAITIKGINDKDPYKFVAFNGTPTSLKISANKNNPDDPLVLAGEEQPLYFWVYDENGVELNVNLYAQKPSIYLSPASYSADYYVTSGTIDGNKVGFMNFMKAGLTAEIKAEYHSLVYDNTGKETVVFPATVMFTSVPEEQWVGTVVERKIDIGNNVKLDMSMPISDNGTLAIKVKSSKGGDPVLVESKNLNEEGRVQIDNFQISFEETNQDILAIEKSTLKIVPFKQGTATVVVNMWLPDANGNFTIKVPIDVLSITITGARSMATVSLSKTTALVGNTPTSCNDEITISAKDQYGAPIKCEGVQIIALSKNAKDMGDDLEEAVSTAGNKISINNSKDLLTNVCGTKDNSAQLQLQVKVCQDGAAWVSQTLTFYVRVQKSVGTTFTPSLAAVDGKYNGENVARFANNADSAAFKYVTVQAFQMNSGIRDHAQVIELYPQSGTPDANKYYVKVMKNGQDVTYKGNVWLSKHLTYDEAKDEWYDASAVTIGYTRLGDIKGAVSGSALATVTGGAYKIDYTDYGAGTYSVHLFLGTAQKAVWTGSVTSDAGSYGAVTRLYEEVTGITVGAADSVEIQQALRDCFKVICRNGWQDSPAPYIVEYNNTATDYVYVDKIRFYESLVWYDADENAYDTNLYAEYVVPIGVSLKRK